MCCMKYGVSSVIPWFYCSGYIREVEQFWETMLPKDRLRAHLHPQRAHSRKQSIFMMKPNHLLQKDELIENLCI